MPVVNDKKPTILPPATHHTTAPMPVVKTEVVLPTVKLPALPAATFELRDRTPDAPVSPDAMPVVDVAAAVRELIAPLAARVATEKPPPGLRSSGPGELQDTPQMESFPLGAVISNLSA